MENITLGEEKSYFTLPKLLLFYRLLLSHYPQLPDKLIIVTVQFAYTSLKINKQSLNLNFIILALKSHEIAEHAQESR